MFLHKLWVASGSGDPLPFWALVSEVEAIRTSWECDEEDLS